MVEKHSYINKKLFLWGVNAILLVLWLGVPIHGKVKGIEILYRHIFADGMTFGSVGSYEVIKGKLYYEIDPQHPANAAIVDLQYAPFSNLPSTVEHADNGFLMREEVSGLSTFPDYFREKSHPGKTTIRINNILDF